MRRPVGFRAAVTTVVVATVAAVSLAAPGTAAGAPADSEVRYVALGDSRAAGPSLDRIAETNGCKRSNLGYPNLVARGVNAASFLNLSCSGARTENVTNTPQQTSSGAVPPQIDRLPADTTLVTLSIGGNDIRWPKLISRCYASGPGGDAGCRTDPAITRDAASALADLAPKVWSTLAAIRAKAPFARVVLVGHGGIFDNRGCWPNLPISDADAVWVNGFFAVFNGVLATAAATSGAQFVDVAAGSQGHDACAAPDQRWFEGRQAGPSASPLHPNAAGMAHMARRVLDVVHH
ncbi:SGNH/GDSL hydrolase family protein [Prescottella agglutinans]|uniref:SGNH/GDSL hydrolase family protein n=1 Tax=Prescottella agglutinans TaxID=1644129 RepID=A0A3S3E9T5_9NOCA|nr:SGNH/GDSL hydrolase family protein [Prescottella agglutinans]RVW09049.1 SGNH/GDSL hydrolase family protein [Prescottella agglutinans]